MASPEATSGLPLVRPPARARPVVGEPMGRPVFGDRHGLFGLVVKNTLLTIVTLGIYRFWARTALRRFYWANAAVAGDRFEYTGTGAELFVGFLIVMMMLGPLFGAFAVVQLLTDPESYWRIAEGLIYAAAIYVFIATALFRARRYRLSRTRWRGIRFAQDGSTWRFIGLTLAWTALVAVTLGVGFPWLRWAQQRYMMRSTLLGDRRFGFEGSPRALVWRWLLVLACFVLPLIVAGVLGLEAAMASDPSDAEGADDDAAPDPAARRQAVVHGLLVIGLTAFALIGGGLAFLNYRITEFRAFAGATRLGAVAVRSQARVGPVIGAALRGFACFVGGYTLLMLILLPAILVQEQHPGAAIALGIPVAIGFFAMLFIGVPVITELIVRFAILRHVLGTLELSRLDTLDDIAQSAARTPRVGEGLADAFDIGTM